MKPVTISRVDFPNEQIARVAWLYGQVNPSDEKGLDWHLEQLYVEVSANPYNQHETAEPRLAMILDFLKHRNPVVI